ncbi:hypothetical protein CY34DRAFT_810955 [Suillus luteus UH-Slu-Lm8-n1]|uniref:Uncharacterized protein n=1 Tax=Suillus luteus UH-Slu-Lm8-n1 TaxID=930992 RepID=A0A0C9ZHB4_9AGAM|nr:hypothetical protein CY34DRAFT_810955 [Suillus luteus UH-Slu-Lm8-n1]
MKLESQGMSLQCEPKCLRRGLRWFCYFVEGDACQHRYRALNEFLVKVNDCSEEL